MIMLLIQGILVIMEDEAKEVIRSARMSFELLKELLDTE